PLQKPFPQFSVHRLASELLDVFAELGAEGFRSDRVIGEPNDRKLVREQRILGQIAQGRNQLSLRQVAAGPKNHHDARARLLPLPVESFSRVHSDVTLLIFNSDLLTWRPRPFRGVRQTRISSQTGASWRNRLRRVRQSAQRAMLSVRAPGPSIRWPPGWSNVLLRNPTLCRKTVRGTVAPAAKLRSSRAAS